MIHRNESNLFHGEEGFFTPEITTRIIFVVCRDKSVFCEEKYSMENDNFLLVPRFY